MDMGKDVLKFDNFSCEGNGRLPVMREVIGVVGANNNDHKTIHQLPNDHWTNFDMHRLIIHKKIYRF